MRFRLRTLLLLPAVIAFGIVGVASVPRTDTLLHNERWSGRYTGLDLLDGWGILGRRYFEFTIDDSPRRSWVISYSGGEYGDAVCRYPDGTVALTGRCRIERTDSQVFPLIGELAEATSFTPDGALAATVENGSGKAILFYPDGTKNWEMTYDRFLRTEVLHFDEYGDLRSPEQPAADTEGGG